MTLRPREKALVALLIVVGGYQGFRLVGGALGEGPLNLANRKSAQRREAEQVTLDEVARLEISDLAAAVGSSEIGRDPFRFDAVSRSTTTAAERLSESSVLQPVAETARADLEPPAPLPPRIDFDFLGSFGRSGRPMAVFSDGEAIINAFVGDTLQEKFVVDEIGYETVDIRFVDFPDTPPETLDVGN
ncbi:MAG: hypothetical protein VYE73_05355 [Acidobacteriota bacterium]|nr:hypothetical protein [Acidobacteriota bacterium]